MTTKEKLVESARVLIAENGYNNTKVEDITQKAEVAKGTFYIYFKTKEEIFLEILSEIFKKMNERVESIKFTKDLKGNLRSFISYLHEGSMEDVNNFKIFDCIDNNIELRQKAFNVGDSIRNKINKYMKLLLECSKDELHPSVLTQIDLLYSPLEKFVMIYMGDNFYREKKYLETIKFSKEEMDNHIDILVEFLYRALKK